MRTAAYIGKLASAGVDLKVAQAHGEALEEAVTDDDVTRDFLDARLTELEGRLRMEIYRVATAQVLALAGIMFALLKLVK